jgi:hypothetical protein
MLSAIESQLAAHILTSSIETCVFGFPANVSTYPSAACSWRSGSVDKIAGNGTVRDMALTLEVQIDSNSTDSAVAAAEEISRLWYDAARFAELSALGVISILPAALQPPAALQQTVQVAKALVSFEVVIRMT